VRQLIRAALEGYRTPHSATFVTVLKHKATYRELAVAGIARFLAGFRHNVRQPCAARLTWQPITPEPLLMLERSDLLDASLTSEHLERAEAQFPDRRGPVSVEDYDPGLTGACIAGCDPLTGPGVIDRLVAEVRLAPCGRALTLVQRADYYIVGEPRVCARASSYIASIVADRNARTPRPVEAARVVDYFGSPPASLGHRYPVSHD